MAIFCMCMAFAPSTVHCLYSIYKCSGTAHTTYRDCSIFSFSDLKTATPPQPHLVRLSDRFDWADPVPLETKSSPSPWQLPAAPRHQNCRPAPHRLHWGTSLYEGPFASGQSGAALAKPGARARWMVRQMVSAHKLFHLCIESPIILIAFSENS